VLELPEWMFDLGACRYLNIAVAARVSCGSLRALKTLLESFVQLSGSLSLSQLTPTRNRLERYSRSHCLYRSGSLYGNMAFQPPINQPQIALRP